VEAQSSGGRACAGELPLFGALGFQVLAFFRYFGELTLLHWDTWKGLLLGHLSLRETVKQMADIGIGSLPIAVVTLVFSGMVLAYHVAHSAQRYGAASFIGYGVAESVCRELGPVLVAIVVAARAGSSMAAEIGTMKVTEQIDALRSMAVHPVDYLVAPRYVAGVILVPVLAFVGDVVGVFGGYLMAVISPYINQATYFASIPGSVLPWEVLAGLVKAVVFGMVIVLVGCHQGLYCEMASEEVGHATTRSVVYSIMLIYAVDLALTAVLYPA
jgi:phospholipid/cholesterol/gamma-HCH transport system permease protein